MFHETQYVAQCSCSLLWQTDTTFPFDLWVTCFLSLIPSSFGIHLLCWNLLSCIGNRERWLSNFGWTRVGGTTKPCRTVPQGQITLRWITQNHLAIIDDKAICLTISIHWTQLWLGTKPIIGILGLFLLFVYWTIQPRKHVQLLPSLNRPTSSHIITPMCSHHPPLNRLSKLSFKQPKDWIAKAQQA